MSIRKTYPMQACKIMLGLGGMDQMLFTRYIVVLDDDVDVHNTSEVRRAGELFGKQILEQRRN